MKNKNLMPHQIHPTKRTTIGQFSSELAELSEEVLQGSFSNSGVLASLESIGPVPLCASGCLWCSFDGEDTE